VTVMKDIIDKKDFDPAEGIIRHSEGVDILPANDSLTGMEIVLAPIMGREIILKKYIEKVKSLYNFVLIDTLCAYAHKVSNAEIIIMLSLHLNRCIAMFLASLLVRIIILV
ncbi:MAG: AAA family ATPase, partial [Oscillospiraceae bacterium]|nr:AAA family ATPase [Oscillospiraceae bacterium]